MEKTLEQIEALIAENVAEKNRTGHLEVALGGLRTARDQVEAHLKKSTEKLKAENLKSDVSVSDVSVSVSQPVSVSKA